MKYTHLYSDDEGKSHFEDLNLKLQAIDFAPQAPPLDISVFGKAEQCSILRVEPGWKGEKRCMQAGELALVEDTTCKGHKSRVVGDADVVFAVAKLA